jgi:translocator protein
MIIRLIVFVLLNFGALAVGGFFTGAGVPSEWYQSLQKAPWTPPGWVFGFAWTLIMLCFSWYMAKLWPVAENRTALLWMYGVQWVLNVSWNPLFFHYHQTLVALVAITALTLLVAFFLVGYASAVGKYTFLLAPYLVWLLIATSLNAYICWNNPLP